MESTSARRRAGVGRRGFLQAGAALSLGAAGVGSARPAVARGSAHRAPRAANVIFMVVDGMSMGTLTLGDMLLKVRAEPPSRWSGLWRTEGARRAIAATFSANALVTDSAAGGSAWGIGEKVDNAVLNITPDGRRPTPILVHAAQNAKATGLVTTTRVTHATPASFLVNHPTRDEEDDIARQMLARGFDLCLGGGAKHFPPALLARHAGVRVVRTRDELLAAPETGPLLGLFADSHMSFSLDRADHEPTLEDMTRVALQRLAQAPAGFLLQVEGGRVDHGGHENDVGALLYDQLAFDRALGVAIDFTLARNDTLLIVTTDHATANPGLTFYGPEGIKRFERCRHLRRSYEWIAAQRGTAADTEALGTLITQATGVALSRDELGILERAARRQPVDPFGPANGEGQVLGSLLANHLGVAFLSPNHTSDYVEVTAIGPGAADLPPVIENTHLHAMMVRALDLAPAKPA